MKCSFLRAILMLVIAFASVSSWAKPVVTIANAWVRATVSGQKATGAFMDIKADEAVRLVKVTTPVTPIAQIHTMSMTDGVMQMSQLKDGLAIPAGHEVVLKPGGYHIMMLNLKHQVKQSQTVKLVLTFEDDKRKRFTEEVKAPVRPLSFMPHDMTGDMHGMAHDIKSEHKDF